MLTRLGAVTGDGGGGAGRGQGAAAYTAPISRCLLTAAISACMRAPACLRQAQLLQAGQQRAQRARHIQAQRLWRRLQHQGSAGDPSQVLLLQQEGVHRLRLLQLHNRHAASARGGACLAARRLLQAQLDEADCHALSGEVVSSWGGQAAARRRSRHRRHAAVGWAGVKLRRPRGWRLLRCTAGRWRLVAEKVWAAVLLPLGDPRSDDRRQSRRNGQQEPSLREPARGFFKGVALLFVGGRGWCRLAQSCNRGLLITCPPPELTKNPA